VSPTPTLRLKVITPHRILCEADAAEVSLPGLDGLIGILPDHRPMVIALGEGTLTYRADDGETEDYEVRGGYAEIRGDQVLVFTEI
jgi:F-type H+-transporting ATPase subunit epsilon